jgi:GNAT superfamily N-acetyltransferase
MAGDDIRIRAARPGDAAALSRLLNALSVHEGMGDDVYTPESVARQFFGAEPVLRVLIAENASGPVGYAAFEETFNTDCGEPGLWLHDIYVDAPARGRGLGRRLMAAVARTALAEGCTSVWWGVLDSNHAALRFYAGLGARDEGARLQELDGPALVSLARGAPIVDW